MNSYDNNGQINNYNNSYMNEPEQRKIPYVTAVLVAINVVVFLVMEFFGSTESGEYMYAHGASYAPDIFENGQWYRILTSMFMHFGAEHLINNMVMLLYPWISDRRKLRKSKIPYNILYMRHSRRHNLIRNRNDNRRVLHKCRSFRSNFWHIRSPTGNDIQKQKTTGTGICTTTNLVIYTNGLRQHAGRRRLDGTSGRSSYRSCYCISNI